MIDHHLMLVSQSSILKMWPIPITSGLTIDVLLERYDMYVNERLSALSAIFNLFSNRWSIISDNYLLNVFTDYNYSDSLYFKSMLDKSKDLNKILSYFYKNGSDTSFTT
jgi:hypothetical protein